MRWRMVAMFSDAGTTCNRWLADVSLLNAMNFSDDFRIRAGKVVGGMQTLIVPCNSSTLRENADVPVQHLVATIATFRRLRGFLLYCCDPAQNWRLTASWRFSLRVPRWGPKWSAVWILWMCDCDCLSRPLCRW